MAPITPTYSLSTSTSTVKEGESLNTFIATTNVAAGTQLYWSISGTLTKIVAGSIPTRYYSTLTSDDFSAGYLQGSSTISSDGTSSFIHAIANDHITEGTETLEIKLFSDPTRSIQVGSTVSISILDTSKASPPMPPELMDINISTDSSSADILSWAQYRSSYLDQYLARFGLTQETIFSALEWLDGIQKFDKDLSPFNKTPSETGDLVAQQYGHWDGNLLGGNDVFIGGFGNYNVDLGSGDDAFIRDRLATGTSNVNGGLGNDAITVARGGKYNGGEGNDLFIQAREPSSSYISNSRISGDLGIDALLLKGITKSEIRLNKANPAQYVINWISGSTDHPIIENLSS